MARDRSLSGDPRAPYKVIQGEGDRAPTKHALKREGGNNNSKASNPSALVNPSVGFRI